jgi:hypothetical protein
MTTESMTTAAVWAAIEDWYTQADQALGLMRHLSMQADDRMIHSVACCAKDTDTPPTKEHVDQLFAGLLKSRKAKVDGLRTNAEFLWSYLGSLNSFATGPIWPRFEIAYCEVGDFQAGNYSGGRAAAAVLIPLGYDVKRWAYDLADLWSVDIVNAADTKLAKAFEDIRGRCPFTTEIDNAIRQRLMLEKSRLLRDLLAYPVAAGDSLIPASELPQAVDDQQSVAAGGLEPRFRNAYYAAKHAEIIAGKPLKYGEAWELLRDEGTDDIPGLGDYELPVKGTFEDYCAKAAKLVGEPRKERRQNRTSRSVVRRSDL